MCIRVYVCIWVPMDLHVYPCVCHMCVGVCGIHKRVLDSLEVEIRVSVTTGHECWEPNLDPGQQQRALFTVELTLCLPVVRV